MAKKPEEAVKVTAAKIEANGIVRPKDGTATGNVWAQADALSAKAGAPAKRSDVIAACVKKNINESTAATQYGRWRVFHGLGREVKAPVAKVAKPAKVAAAPTKAKAEPKAKTPAKPAAKAPAKAAAKPATVAKKPVVKAVTKDKVKAQPAKPAAEIEYAE